MKKTLISSVLAGLMAMSSSAYSLNFETGTGQTWHFTNWETRLVQDQNGDYNTLEGLIRIDQIFDDNGTIFATGPDAELVGYFTGFQVRQFSEGLGAPFKFEGGEIKLWLDTTPDFNPSKDPTVGSGSANLASESPGVVAIAPDAAPTDQAPLLVGNVGAGVTDGVLWADIVADTGISLTDPGATLSGAIRNDVTTDDGFGSPALQGDGASFLSIIGGSQQANYDSNGFTDLVGGVHDFRLDNTFFITNGPAPIGPVSFDNTTNGWDTHSDDPVKALSVPEPASPALLGLGLSALGLLGGVRRRKSA